MTCDPKVWHDTLCLLQGQIPDFAYAAWISPLAVKLGEDRVVLGCPSSFHRDRVRIQFHELLEESLRSALEIESPSAKGLSVELVSMSEFAEIQGHVIDVGHLDDRVRAERKIAIASEQTLHRVAAQPIARAAVGGSALSDGGALSDSGALADRDRGIACPRGSDAADEAPRAQLEAVPDRARRATGKSKKASASIARRGHVGSAGPAGPASDALATDQPELPFSFESFVVGPCNALAREAALALARIRQRSLNQLYLGGESGMGKTHLARATAAEARRFAMSADAVRAGNSRTRGDRPGVVYTSAEKFTSDFVSAMRNGRGDDFKRRYRAPIGLLVVEDIQFFSGRVKTQLELFHTLQHVLDAGGRVLLTGDRSPQELKGLDDRVRAQVGQGFVAELEAPDAIVRRHILRSKAAAGGIGLPEDCLEALVEASRGSVRDIESMLIQVVTTASLLGRSIDLDLTEDAIALKTSSGSVIPTKTVAVSEIVRIVSAFFGKRPEALASKSRRRDVLVPRQLAMYLAHRYTQASFAEIGRGLGRGHPSVRNAIERVERQVLENAPIRYQVEALSERIDSTLKVNESNLSESD